MPPTGGPPLPPELIPGGNTTRTAKLPPMNTGVYRDQYQTQSPTSASDTQSPGGWNNSPLSRKQSLDDRGGRPMDSGRSLRERSNPRGGSRANGGPGTPRRCKKCAEQLLGQFVRALGNTYHLECFQCKDCGEVVASKFFPVEADDGSGQYPLCETDYFRRLELLCFECGGALRGSYITALDRKYHIEHFTCSVCPTVFGAQDSYYEHEGKVYCHYHYSTQFAQRCHGCRTAILKQFVEIFRNGENQHWHPECYMIHKFWNVRLSPSPQEFERPPLDVDISNEERERVRAQEERMEDKVYRIWSILSAFEESSAACISDMLLHVSNGAYIDGVVVSKRFIFHIEVLFRAIDKLAPAMSAVGTKELAYLREAKLLCKKMVAFFGLLSKTQDTGVRKLGVTQELLSLVTALAHYMKLLIRIGLQGALRFERDTGRLDNLFQFLEQVDDLDAVCNASPDLFSGLEHLDEPTADQCAACQEQVDDECIILGRRRWHMKPPHLVCGACQDDLTKELGRARWSEKNDRPYCRMCAEQRGHDIEAVGGFTYVTKLQQYLYLLRVAMARLLALLRAAGTLPHTSDDPNLQGYDANDGRKLVSTGEVQTPLQRANARSKSDASASEEAAGSSSLEQTVGEMRRLRSMRNERHLSTINKKARTSRIIDGPQGSTVQPGTSGDGTAEQQRSRGLQIVEDRELSSEQTPDMTFGNQDALTLDDIPRIVAAEQAKEQRPNAFKHARTNLLGSGAPHAKLMNGDGHQVEAGGRLDSRSGPHAPPRATKYFSELSALEYFIVRHVAVLSMEPLLDGLINLEELLGLIESRKPTIWNIFGRAFKNDGKKAGKKKGVFGVALETLVDRDGTESTNGVGPGTLRIPTFIDDAISAMRQMDMSVEGVFRKNGNIKRLRDTTEIIDTKYELADLNKENPVQVAALLKKFLRELPDPLLTLKLHRLFIASQKMPDAERRRRILHLTCCLLPKTHRDAMEVLFTFLNWAASFSHVDEESGSKMDIHNLATVMTPNILYSNNKAPGVDDSFLAIEAVSTLIEYNDTMCEVPNDLQAVLTDSTLFNGSADITTKEILKRYGDIAKIPAIQRASTSNDSPSHLRAGSPRGISAPFATRIDEDPSQATAWQMQSSVRHVQGPGTPEFGAMNSPPAEYDYMGSQQPPMAPMPPDRGGVSDTYNQQGSRQGYGQPSQQIPYRSRPSAGPMGV